MEILPYNLEETNTPGVYMTSVWGSYIIPSSNALIWNRVDLMVDRARIIFEARKDLPPETLKTRLDKIRFKLNYHFKRIFK